MARARRLIKEKNKLPEEEVQYLPPHIKEGRVQSAVLVCEGEVVEKTPVIVPDKEVVVEEEVAGKNEQILVNESSEPSVLEEAGGDLKGDSADSEGEQVTVASIVSNTPRVQLAEFTLADPTLARARALADKKSEGYEWEEGLVFRSRLDEWGSNYRQLCLPQRHRQKCLELAHEREVWSPGPKQDDRTHTQAVLLAIFNNRCGQPLQVM